MIIRPASISIVLGLMSLCAAARAGNIVFWRHNPITPQAIASDPALAGMQSWSLVTTYTEGDFAAAGLRATLPSGSVFYRHPQGGYSRPSLVQQSAIPALEFHTYVTQPRQSINTGQSPPTILGGFPETDPPSPASLGGTLDTLPGTFSVIWGNPQPSQGPPPGTYELARLTFPPGVLPAVHPESLVALILPDRILPIPATVPEPTALGMLIVAMSSLVPCCRTRRPNRR